MSDANVDDTTQEICGICLEPMSSHDQGELLPCGHRYHIACIRKWQLHSKDFKCPTCRKESKTLRRVHDNIEIDLKYWCNVSLIEQFTKLQLLSDDEDNADQLQDENENGDGPNDDVAIEERSRITLRDTDTDDFAETETNRTDVEPFQCALCGRMDEEVTLYCLSCQTLFHPSCLSELLCEVGERRWRCTECYGKLSYLRDRGPSSLMVRDSNCTIHDGRIIDKRSLLTERIYTTISAPQQLTYADKCKIQAFVRSELDSYYHRGILSKQKYININKKVSRRLYGLSQGGFDPDRINYREQARISIREAI